MTQQIALSRGKFATVDDEDYESISRYKWTYDPKGYAMRNVNNGREKFTLYMHRSIMNALSGQVVDHINGDGLDNRRINLRVVTQAQNVYNVRPQKKAKTSQFKGVSLNRTTQRWQAFIKKDTTRRYLGMFDNEIDAARAYNAAARHYFGQNAYINHVPDDTLTIDDLSKKSKSSAYHGVSIVTESHKWKAQIQVNKVKIFIGNFASEVDAARAYDAYVIANGLRSRLNFPQETT